MTIEITPKEYWDKYWGGNNVKYPIYDLTKGTFYSYNLLLSKYINNLIKKFNKKQLRIIDCGCGEGLILKYLCEQFPSLEVWGIEYSDSYNKAKSMAEYYGYDISLIKGDILDDWSPDLNEYFDMVVSFGLIEHFKKPMDVLSQIMKVLTKGGCFITIIPNFDGVYNLLWKLYDSENYNYHVPIKKEELIELHYKLGLNDISFYSLGTTTIPGVHNVNTLWQKVIKFITVNINGRILHKLSNRQLSLEKAYPLPPSIACVGYKGNSVKIGAVKRKRI